MFGVAGETHAHDYTWKLISIFVAAPAVAFCIYNSVKKEMAHHEHERGEFKEFSHLRIRSKVDIKYRFAL